MWYVIFLVLEVVNYFVSAQKLEINGCIVFINEYDQISGRGMANARGM